MPKRTDYVPPRMYEQMRDMLDASLQREIAVSDALKTAMYRRDWDMVEQIAVVGASALATPEGTDGH